MPESLQNFIDVIKDYGAAIISAIGVGGIGAIAGVIVKIKQSMDKTKETMSAALKKKDDVIEQNQVQVNSVIEQNKQLLEKIDTLTNDVYRLESEVRDKK